ncbi:MAG: zf-HC2 domain-containing protein [Acidobacteriia bacterium]|nr:zf-HC2 domain-containing protein [Terriglobia bacterium]
MREQISTHVDGMLDAAERKQLVAHLGSCPSCAARLKSTKELRAGLRQMEVPRVPAALAVQLQVLASHERSRRVSGTGFKGWLRHCGDRIRLSFDNLMRPLALPLAGGLLSAMLLFGVLVPTLSFRHEKTSEPPLSFTEPYGLVVNWTENLPRLEPVDAEVSSDDNVVELTIDDAGCVADYNVRQGQLTPEMLSIIKWSSFTPAMFFGRPTWGKKLIVIPQRRRNARG